MDRFRTYLLARLTSIEPITSKSHYNDESYWIPSSDNDESSDDDDDEWENIYSDDDESSSQQICPGIMSKYLYHNAINGDIIITMNEYFFHFVIKITNQGNSVEFYFNPRCFNESYKDNFFFLLQFKQMNGKYFIVRVSNVWLKPESKSFKIFCHWLIKLKSLFGNNPKWFGNLLSNKIIKKYLYQFHHAQLAECLLNHFVDLFNKLDIIIIKPQHYQLSSSLFSFCFANSCIKINTCI